MHDFLIPELGRAVPYGVYDIASNAGWVSVGIDHDTASFAVNAIRRWCRDREESLGKPGNLSVCLLYDEFLRGIV